MKMLVLVIVGVIAVIILLAGVAALIGSRLSKSHTATRSIFLRQSPQNVYAVIRDFPSAPAWRTDVKRVEVQTQPDGKDSHWLSPTSWAADRFATALLGLTPQALCCRLLRRLKAKI